MTLITRCLHPGLSELVPGFRFLVEISSSVELLVFTLLDFYFFKEASFAEETALLRLVNLHQVKGVGIGTKIYASTSVSLSILNIFDSVR